MKKCGRVLVRAIGIFLTRLGIRGNPIEERRVEISRKIFDVLNGTVKYGLFSGLKLLRESSWGGEADTGAKLLGLYEQEVLDFLSYSSKKHEYLINLGAGDGYYTLGALNSRIVQKAYAYEISDHGSNLLREGAILNKLSEKLNLLGEAKHEFWSELPKEVVADSLLVVDIEGGEFDLFDVNTFNVFKNSTIVIEVHEWAYNGSGRANERLVRDSSLTHDYKIVQTGSRDLSGIPEIVDYSDTDRWLICSEGRPMLMSWILLSPKKEV